jgi:UDP-3-O-[3-hydroxymyristoyl] glucosamine N-acyltransferase
MKEHYTLGELAKLFSVKPQGNSDCKISGIASLERAQANQISFLIHPKFRDHLTTTKAAAVIISPQETVSYAGNALVTENPHLLYAKVAELFEAKEKNSLGTHPSSVIGVNCDIAPSASIAAHCVIGARVKIGKNVVIESGTCIGNDSVIGDDCHFASRVTLYHHVRVGERVLIHSGAVLGADGFGFAKEKEMWRKIPQLGGVVIGNDVEIGANTTIDRGALEDTIIGNGVKIDNQVLIAHNVQVGDHTIIAGCTAIAGSVKIGRHCILGGGVLMADHVEISDYVALSGATMVEKSLTGPAAYGSCVGSMPMYKSKKVMLLLQQLGEIVRRIKKLEKEHECDGH